MIEYREPTVVCGTAARKKVRKARPPPPPDALSYRPSDAARLTGVHRNTLLKWIASGQLQAVRFNSRLTLINGASLRALVNPK